MFNVYDTTTKHYISKTGWKIKRNAERIAQSQNIKTCGIAEMDKPENERRFIVKEV